MATGYRSGGVDFDDLFEPEVGGNGVAAAGLRRGGVPLRYAARALGSKRADVGHRVGGSDVSNLWAAKGSVTYVSDGGLPLTLEDYRQAPPGGTLTASVSFEYRNTGALVWTGGAGTWLGGGSAAGDYEIRFDVVSGSGFTGSVGQWLRLNASRGGSLSVTSSGTVTIGLHAVVRITMRRRSNQAVVFVKDVTMSATVDRDSSV